MYIYMCICRSTHIFICIYVKTDNHNILVVYGHSQSSLPYLSSSSESHDHTTLPQFNQILGFSPTGAKTTLLSSTYFNGLLFLLSGTCPRLA